MVKIDKILLLLVLLIIQACNYNECNKQDRRVAKLYEIKGVVYDKYKPIGKSVYYLYTVDGEDTIKGMDIGYFFKCAFEKIQNGDYVVKEFGDTVFKIYRGDQEMQYYMRCDYKCD